MNICLACQGSGRVLWRGHSIKVKCSACSGEGIAVSERPVTYDKSRNIDMDDELLFGKPNDRSAMDGFDDAD